MKITLLTPSNNIKLTKSFHMEGNNLIKTPYPNILNLTSTEITLTSPQDLFDFIQLGAKQGSAMIAGTLSRQIKNESRAGLTDNTQPTHLLSIDIDGPVGIKANSPKGVQSWLDEAIPEIASAKYTLQFSSSNQFSVDPKFHGEFLLKTPLPPQTKQLFIKALNQRLNLITKLNRHDSCISWAIDPVPNLNSQMIFIAPPDVAETIPMYDPNKQQIFFMNNKNDYVISQHLEDIAKTYDPSSEKDIINSLRLKKGLPSKNLTYKLTVDKTEYLSNPDKAIFEPTSKKDDFIIGNLNGGDSNGYYHRDENPFFMYNFKGEPIFKIEDALPDYWNKLQKKTPDNLPTFFAFNDVNTDKTYTKDADKGYTERRSAQKLASWYRTVNIPLEESRKISELKMVDFSFNPTKDEQDLAQKPFLFLNRYVEPHYLSDPDDPRFPRIGQFPYLEKAILNMCGGDKHDYNRFLNWLAFVIQFKKMTKTSWIFRGVQGTGKGVTTEVIQQMVGVQYTVMPTAKTFDDKFTSWAADKLFTIANEAQVSEGGIDLLKTLITDTPIPHRAMGVDLINGENWNNVLLFTNKYAPVSLDPKEEDRRFNVTPYQYTKLKDIVQYPGKEIIERETAHLQYYLQNITVNKKDAMEPENSKSKTELMEQSAHAIHSFTDALENGDLYFFAQELSTTVMTHGQGFIKGKYNELINRFIKQIKEDPLQTVFIRSNELVLLYQYIMDSGKSKPATIIKHIMHEAPKLRIKKVAPSLDKTRRMGIGVDFKLSLEEVKFIEHNFISHINEEVA